MQVKEGQKDEKGQARQGATTQLGWGDMRGGRDSDSMLGRERGSTGWNPGDGQGAGGGRRKGNHPFHPHLLANASSSSLVRCLEPSCADSLDLKIQPEKYAEDSVKRRPKYAEDLQLGRNTLTGRRSKPAWTRTACRSRISSLFCH